MNTCRTCSTFAERVRARSAARRRRPRALVAPRRGTNATLPPCRRSARGDPQGGFCSEVDFYPNATVAEYGRIIGEAAMMAGAQCPAVASHLMQYAASAHPSVSL